MVTYAIVLSAKLDRDGRGCKELRPTIIARSVLFLSWGRVTPVKDTGRELKV